MEAQFCADIDTCPPGRIIAIDPEARRVISQHPIAHTRFSIDSYVTPDGRFLLWSGANAVGQFAVIAFDSIARSAVTVAPLDNSADRLFGHPSRYEVFVSTAPNPFAIDPNGRRTLVSPCQLPRIVSMSGNRQRMVLACASFSSPPSSIPLSIIDQETGVLVALHPNSEGDVELNDDGSELYTLGDAGSPWKLTREDVTTHALLAVRELAPGGQTPFALHVDPRNGRLFIDRPLGHLEVIDPDSLDTLGTISLPANTVHWIAFDPSSPRAYVISSAYGSVMPASTRLDVIDTDSLQMIDGAELTLEALPNAIVVAPRPAPPVGLSATVENTRVTLSWNAGQSHAMTTHYSLEAGSAPGATDLANVDLDLDTSFVVEPVPPGRYFVRVRAENVGGSSEASAEIVVDVP